MGTYEIYEQYRKNLGIEEVGAFGILDYYKNQEAGRVEADKALAIAKIEKLKTPVNTAPQVDTSIPAGYLSSYNDRTQADNPQLVFDANWDKTSYENRIAVLNDWVIRSGSKYLTPESLSQLSSKVKKGEVKEWGVVKPNRSISEVFTDSLANAGGGVVSGLKAATDLFGVDNAASQYLGNATEFYKNAVSDQEKNDLKYNQEQLAALGEDEYLKRFGLAALQAVKAPLRTTSTAVGQLAPLVLGGGALAATRLGAAGAAAITGGAIGAGSVKGGIAETIQNATDDQLKGDPSYLKLRETLSEKDAKKQFGVQQSSYTNSPLLIAGGALAGVVAGALGSVEKGLIGAIAKKETAASIAKQAPKETLIKAFAKEAATEIPQEGFETAAGNIGANQGGANIKTLQGVAEAGGQALVQSIAGASLLKAVQAGQPAAKAQAQAQAQAQAPVTAPIAPTAANQIKEAFAKQNLLDALNDGNQDKIEEARLGAEALKLDVEQIEKDFNNPPQVTQNAQENQISAAAPATAIFGEIARFQPSETGNKPLTESPIRAIAEIQSEGNAINEASARAWAMAHEASYSQYVNGQPRAGKENFIDTTVENILATAKEQGLPLRAKSASIASKRLAELVIREPDYAQRSRQELGDRTGQDGSVRDEASYRKSQSDFEVQVDFKARDRAIDAAMLPLAKKLNEDVLAKIETALKLPAETLPLNEQSFSRIKELPLDDQEKILGITPPQSRLRYQGTSNAKTTAAKQPTSGADTIQSGALNADNVGQVVRTDNNVVATGNNGTAINENTAQTTNSAVANTVTSAADSIGAIPSGGNVPTASSESTLRVSSANVQGENQESVAPKRKISDQLTKKYVESLFRGNAPIKARAGVGGKVIISKNLTTIQKQDVYNVFSKIISAGIPKNLVLKLNGVQFFNTKANSLGGIALRTMDLVIYPKFFKQSQNDKIHTIAHELAHVADNLGGTTGKFSLTSAWDESHKELKAWYESGKEDNKSANSLTYPFSKNFPQNDTFQKTESFAQAFGLYFTNKIDLQNNAPKTFAEIQKIINNERASYDSTATDADSTGYTILSGQRGLLSSRPKNIRQRNIGQNSRRNGKERLDLSISSSGLAEISNLLGLNSNNSVAGFKTSLGTDIAVALVDYKAAAKQALLEETNGNNQALNQANRALLNEMVTAANAGAVITDRLTKSVTDPLVKKILAIAKENNIDADQLRLSAGTYAVARHSLNKSAQESKNINDNFELATQNYEASKALKERAKVEEINILGLENKVNGYFNRAQAGGLVSRTTLTRHVAEVQKVIERLADESGTELSKATIKRITNTKTKMMDDAVGAGDSEAMFRIARELTEQLVDMANIDKAKSNLSKAKSELKAWNDAQAMLPRSKDSGGKSAIPLPSGLTIIEAETIAQDASKADKQVADLYVQAFKDINKDAIKRGAVTQESVDALEAKFPNYVSTSGQVGASETDSIFFSGSRSYFDKAEGAQSYLNSQNTLNNIVAKTRQAGNIVARNSVSKALYDSYTAGSDLFERTGIMDGKGTKHVENGVTYYLTAKNAEVAQGFNAISEDQAKYAKPLTFATNLAGRAVTQYVPIFAVYNFAKDAGTRLFNISGKYDAVKADGTKLGYAGAVKLQRQFFARLLPFSSTYQDAFTFAMTGKESSELAEFRSGGGLLTFTDTLTSEKDVAAQFKKISLSRPLSLLTVGGSKAAAAINKIVHSWNQGFETALLLSSYKAFKDAGFTPKDAAFQTLDMMNFGQRGVVTNTFLRPFYVFANPTAQDALQIKRTIYKNGKINLLAVGQFAALVAAGSALYSAMRDADEEDEFGKKRMDAQGASTASRAILVSDGKGGYYKAPVPFGLIQLAYAMGVALARREHGVYTDKEAAGEIAGAWAKSFAVTGGAEVPMLKDFSTWATYTLSPTLAKPGIAVALNKDTFGNRITLPARADKTASEQGKFQTEEEYKELAKWAEKTIGFDRAPEEYKTIVEGYAFGPLRALLGTVVDKENNTEIKGLDKRVNSPLEELLGRNRALISGSDSAIVNHYYFQANKKVKVLQLRMGKEIVTVPREAFEDRLTKFLKAGATPDEVQLLRANHAYEKEYKEMLAERRTAYGKYLGGDDAASIEMGKIFTEDMIEKRKIVKVYLKQKDDK